MSRAYDNAADGRYQQGGRRNLIINGATQVWQRSTSETGETNGGYHTVDRFRLRISGGTVSSSRQEFTLGQTDVPSPFRYFHRFNPTTSNDNCGIEYRIEDVTTVSGETVTFSIYAKGTNPGGGELDIIFTQNFGSGGSSAVSTTVGTLTLTSSWARYTYTFDIPSISGKTVGTGSYMEIEIGQPDDDESTDAYTFDNTGWQLERGSAVTPFEHRSYGEELALCQRYFQRHVYFMTIGYQNGTSQIIAQIFVPSTFRANPSITYGTNVISLSTPSSPDFNSYTISSLANGLGSLDVGNCVHAFKINVSGWSGNDDDACFVFHGSTSGYEFDAEL